MAKHFFKTIILFTGMILVGLLGVFLINQFYGSAEEKRENNTTVAK